MTITLALSKGRIFTETIPLLQKANIEVLENLDNSRKLIFPTSDVNLRIIMVRATDVPTYVRYGAADIGIAGHDVLMEHGLEGLYTPVNLHLAKCSIALAGDINKYQQALENGRITVATKYTNIACEYFTNKGLHADIIKLYGSMELAPLVGLADVIVDLVSTGNTLKANNLHLIEKICDVSAKLIVNKASYKTKINAIQKLINIFNKVT